MKTLKCLFTLSTLILSCSTVFATDTFTAISASGKTSEGIIWKQTVRKFNPGPTETEFQLGKAAGKEVTVFGDFLQNNKSAQYLGVSVCLAKPIGSVKTSLNLNLYKGLNSTPDKIKITGCANQPIGKNVYVGYGFLYSKCDGSKSYFEAGPQVGVRFNQYCLNLQAVHSSRDRNVVETTFSVQF